MWLLLGTCGVLLIGLLLWIVGERGRLLQHSTRQLIRNSGFHFFRFVHFYVYARWTTRYLITAAGIITRSGPHGKRWFANHYHGKVLTCDEARALIQVNKSIPLRDLDQIIPFPMARDFVLRIPLEIAVLECPCRHARAHHCEPTQVCLVVGQPFVDFVLEHHPDTCRRLTPTEAATLLEAEHQRGHVHSAWFKNVCLGRFFAICNCCKCCCGGIEAMVRHGIPMMTSSGYVARIDESLCVGCGRCEEACPFEAITVHDLARVDTARCLGCGVCVGQCRQGAASLIRDADKGTPLDVRLLKDLSQEPTSPLNSYGLPAEQRR